MTTNHVILSIGCNKPDRMSRITDAIQWLNDNFEDLYCSDIYEMPAINGIDPPYLNSVACVTTDQDMVKVHDLIKQYEATCGRTKESKSEGIIPIDIDIIIWNGNVMRPREYSFKYFTKGYAQLPAVRCNAPALSER